jgi:hypothetical protein
VSCLCYPDAEVDMHLVEGCGRTSSRPSNSPSLDVVAT